MRLRSKMEVKKVLKDVKYDVFNNFKVGDIIQFEVILETRKHEGVNINLKYMKPIEVFVCNLSKNDERYIDASSFVMLLDSFEFEDIY